MSRDEVQKMLEENEGLVWFALNKYYPQFIKDDDIYQVSMIALWQAVETYDTSKGKFATYAVKCIRNGIGCELRKRNRKCIKNEVFISDLRFENGYDADAEWSAPSITKTISSSRCVEEDALLDVAFDNVLNEMTDFQRKCFGSYLTSENGTEAAERLGISRGSMTTTVSRVKTRLIKSFRNGG